MPVLLHLDIFYQSTESVIQIFYVFDVKSKAWDLALILKTYLKEGSVLAKIASSSPRNGEQQFIGGTLHQVHDFMGFRDMMPVKGSVNVLR
jgi:hypothetical protein